jgi:5-methylthioadenosine/S-adenosylhomocysteine deaminase
MVPVNADLQIDAGWLLPIRPASALPLHSLLVRNGAIVDLLPTADAVERYVATTRVDLTRHIVLPGLVNAHCHAAMTLMRGIADDVGLEQWLEERIWPRELAHVSPEFVHDGALLAAAEMLRGGITTCNDMYFFPESTARALRGAGMRAHLGLPVLDFASTYAPDARGYLQRGFEVRDSLRDDPLVSFGLAPHAPYTVSDATFETIVTYAEELGLPIQTHLNETTSEIAKAIERDGVSPMVRLAKLGVLGPTFAAIHAVHCTDEELAQMVRFACHVIHCPSSNLKLGSGIAPVAAMTASGINVALGTDGAASNNSLDLFEEMRLAALLAKGMTGDAAVIPANAALEMATLAGARAIGEDARIGSLERGKSADIIAIDIDCPELSPMFDPVSHVVYAAGRSDVTHAWVAGQLVLDRRELTQCDVPAILRSARHWQLKLA